MQAEREALKREHAILFAAISKALFRADPIGLNFDINADEYEPEVATIMPRLGGAREVRDVTVIVHEEFCRWFGFDRAGSQEKYAAVSTDIWKAWLAASLLAGEPASRELAATGFPVG